MLPCRKKVAVLNADKKHRYGLLQGMKDETSSGELADLINICRIRQFGTILAIDSISAGVPFG